MKQLVLVRHGQSTWNLQNRFTGWVDVDLGVDEVDAVVGWRLLDEEVDHRAADVGLAETWRGDEQHGRPAVGQNVVEIVVVERAVDGSSAEVNDTAAVIERWRADGGEAVAGLK